LHDEYLNKEAVERSRGFTIGGQVIRAVKYADYLVLMAKE
jgi:predicted nucleotidyltransferase